MQSEGSGMIHQALPISERAFNAIGAGSNPLTSSGYDERLGRWRRYWHGGPGPLYFPQPGRPKGPQG